MKKRILTFLLAASMILLTGCHSSNNSTPTGGNPDSSKEELTKLTLNEVAHSIFYAPMYVAIEKDYFRLGFFSHCNKSNTSVMTLMVGI